MTFKPPFPPAAKEYIRLHQDEWPSVIAYKIGVLFNYPCTDRGVREQIKKIKACQNIEVQY
jgi:hypothetical protein